MTSKASDYSDDVHGLLGLGRSTGRQELEADVDRVLRNLQAHCAFGTPMSPETRKYLRTHNQIVTGQATEPASIQSPLAIAAHLELVEVELRLPGDSAIAVDNLLKFHPSNNRLTVTDDVHGADGVVTACEIVKRRGQDWKMLQIKIRADKLPDHLTDMLAAKTAAAIKPVVTALPVVKTQPIHTQKPRRQIIRKNTR